MALAIDNEPSIKTLLTEILEYQQTIHAVMKFLKKHLGTILISKSDYETGDLTVVPQTHCMYLEC
jgi:alkaline phosphatase